MSDTITQSEFEWREKVIESFSKLRKDIREDMDSMKDSLEKSTDEKICAHEREKHKERTSVAPLRIGADTRKWLTKMFFAAILFGSGVSLPKIIALLGG